MWTPGFVLLAILLNTVSADNLVESSTVLLPLEHHNDMVQNGVILQSSQRKSAPAVKMTLISITHMTQTQLATRRFFFFLALKILNVVTKIVNVVAKVLKATGLASGTALDMCIEATENGIIGAIGYGIGYAIAGRKGAQAGVAIGGIVNTVANAAEAGIRAGVKAAGKGIKAAIVAGAKKTGKKVWKDKDKIVDGIKDVVEIVDEIKNGSNEDNKERHKKKKTKKRLKKSTTPPPIEYYTTEEVYTGESYIVYLSDEEPRKGKRIGDWFSRAQLHKDLNKFTPEQIQMFAKEFKPIYNHKLGKKLSMLSNIISEMEFINDNSDVKDNMFAIDVFYDSANGTQEYHKDLNWESM